MYVMITSRVPTDPSPLCGGIFRAEPYSSYEEIHKQRVRELLLMSVVINGVEFRLDRIKFMGKRGCLSSAIDKFYRGNTRDAFVEALKSADLKAVAKHTFSSVDTVKEALMDMYDNDSFVIKKGRVPCKCSNERRFSKVVEVFYNGTTVVIFEHEYAVLRKETLDALILGEDSLYEFVPYSRSNKEKDFGFKKEDLSVEEMVLYEQAVLDGADHNTAYLSALSVDLNMSEEDIPDIGWYRPEQSVQSRNSPLTLMFTSAEK